MSIQGMVPAFRFPLPTAFALALGLAFLAGMGCVPHTTSNWTDVPAPDAGDIIAERESAVSAVLGLAFDLDCASVTIPGTSLEYDAVCYVALVKPRTLPLGAAVPAGERALVALYARTDVRVGDSWPVTLDLVSDFGDPAPFDPGFRVHRLNTDEARFVAFDGATATNTSVSFGLRPGYWLVTVRDSTPYATDLLGSSETAEVAFPSQVASEASNAFCLQADGTDLVRLTNSLATGYRDRPYVSRDGLRVVLVRDGGGAPDRLYATTPSNPQRRLVKVAEARDGWPIGDVSFLATSIEPLVAGFLDLAGVDSPGVFYVPIAGVEPARQVYADPGAVAPRSVCASPDATRAAVTTSRWASAGASGNRDVAVIDLSQPADQEPLRLTAGLTAEVDSVTWSPDGWIYFGGSAGGEHRIWRVQPDGSSLSEIEALLGARGPAASPDGGFVMLAREGSLLRYALGDGSLAAVGPPANGYGHALVSDEITKVSWLGR